VLNAETRLVKQISSLYGPCTQAEGGDGGGPKAEARDTTSNVETQQTLAQRTYYKGFRQNTPSALPELHTYNRRVVVLAKR
jgi:hypothetical protein